MAGAGTVGTGGLGVGGWQIYEEANPSTHKTLTRQGYTWNPVAAPREAKPENSRYDTNRWDCANRLFPNLEIKEDTNTSLPVDNTDQSLLENIPTIKDSENFLSCAIMELKPVSLQGYSKANQIYSKSEVVVKGRESGWIMWTFVSTVSEKNSSGNTWEDYTNFMYRLFFLKKTNSKWEVANGMEWMHYIPGGSNDGESFVIAPPKDKHLWLQPEKPRSHKDVTPFQERVGAWIGEVDANQQSGGKDLLGSFDIYTVANKDEFWGTDGEFKVTQDGIGRKSVQNFYVKDVGWKKKDWNNAVNVADKLKEWYKPFKGRKVKWSDLGEGCSAWSKVRGRKISDLDSDIQALCYYR